MAKVTNLTAQPFLEQEFALLLVNHRLGFGQVKRRWMVLATNRAVSGCSDKRAGCSRNARTRRGP